MKNLLKTSLACLCLLISVNVLKSQNCDVSKSDISMKVLSPIVYDSEYQYTTIEVTIDGFVQRIEVGNNICSTINRNGVYRCTGTFTSRRDCIDPYNPYNPDDHEEELKCYVTELDCTTKHEGCVVVIAGKNNCFNPPYDPPVEN